MQKLCIINSAALLFLKSTRPFPPEGHVLELDWIFIGLVINGSILQLANMNSKIVIEKDWVVCLNKQHQDMNLEFLNSRLRFVDLFSDMIAPLLISGLAERFSSQVAIIFVAIVSFASIFIEIGILVRIFDQTPTLHSSNQDTQRESLPISKRLLSLMKYPVTVTCLSISFLYLTVLTINTVMISYLLYEGNDALYISCLRLVSVVCGLLATFTLETMIRIMGINQAGLFSISFQCICLSVVISSFYIKSTISSVLFLVGVCLSRWGLWSFDLVQQQLIQENIPEHEIHLISGLEISLESLAQLIAYSLTMIWSDPQSFWFPCHISFVSVLCGALTFIYYTNISICPESVRLLDNQDADVLDSATENC